MLPTVAMGCLQLGQTRPVILGGCGLLIGLNPERSIGAPDAALRYYPRQSLTDVANQPQMRKPRIRLSVVFAVIVIVLAWLGMVIAALKFIARGMPR